MTLRYVPLRISEVEVFHRLAVDPHIRRFLLDDLVLPLSWAREEVERSVTLDEEHGVGLWLVYDGEVAVGFCGFRRFESLGPHPQLLYAFIEEATGRGHASATCAWLLAQGASFGRIEAAVDAPNVKSVRVLEKNGFVRCGVVPGEHGDTLLFEHASEAERERLPVAPGNQLSLTIAHTHDGKRLQDDEQAELLVTVEQTELIVTVDAPFYDDPPPAGDPGPTPELWNHEVVELMLLGEGDRYVEIELSPFGHYLVLLLEGRRNVVHQGMLMHYEAKRPDASGKGGRWSGTARIPNAWLPLRCERLNAFAIHGEGATRRYLAWQPRRDPGPHPQPDFHQLDSFAPVRTCKRVMLGET